MKVNDAMIVVGDEIDLKVLWHLIASRKAMIAKTLGTFFVLGIIISLLWPVEYEATCRLMPENQEDVPGDLSGLGGIAGLAGINLNLGASSSLSPDIYPEIVNSVPFQLELIHTKIPFTTLDTLTSSYDYLTSINEKSVTKWLYNYTIGLPSQIRSNLSRPQQPKKPVDYELISISQNDWEVIEKFRKRTFVSVDKKTGIITVGASMPDPLAVAVLGDIVVKQLTERIISYKTGKALDNLEFIEARYAEAEKNYKEKQKDVAIFIDKNKFISSSLFETQLQSRQNDLDIAYDVFKSLAGQLEQAKIKVKEETPVFTTLEPLRIPTEKSEPRRVLITLLSCLFGIILSMSLIIIKGILNTNDKRSN